MRPLFDATVQSTAQDIRFVPYEASTFLYISMGKHEPPAWLVELSMRNDSRALWGTYATPWAEPSASGRMTSVHIPKTSWTTGRNALYTEALRGQRTRGKREEYMIFCDRDAGPLAVDASIVQCCASSATALCNIQPPLPQEDPYAYLHRVLSSETPPVASVRKSENISRNSCAMRACTSDSDAHFQAFHALASPLLLPYIDVMDHISIWNSAAIMIELVELHFRHEAVRPVKGHTQC